MNKLKRYIAVTLLLIGVISSSSISYANIFGWGEEIPASYNGGTQRDGITYSIIPRVSGGGDFSGMTTGIGYERERDFDHPDDPTKDIITSISYQVVSTSDYIYGRPTWRTARIYLYLSVYDPNTGQMIPLGFYIRPLPLQNITNATTQWT